MPDLHDPRYTEQAFVWAEQQIGGRLVRKEKQERWRPAWFLDFEMPDGSVKNTLLRGYRSPSGTSEHDCRERLRMEAGLCKAMGESGCKVAAFHGYEPNGGWFLMDVLPGSPYVTRVKDPDMQASLMRQYYEAIAYLHKLDYTKLDLPDNVPSPNGHEHAIRQHLEIYRGPFDATSNKPPEPVIHLCLWWLSQHKPKPVDRWSLTTGDIGADQFMFEDGKLTGFFDLEMGYIGDSLQDIGLTRMRDMCYPVDSFPNAIRHWSEVMERELDRESVSYWSVVGMLQGPMLTYPLWINPGAFTDVHRDSTFLHGFNPLYLRGACEVLAEYYGVDTPLVPPPVPRETFLDRVPNWIVKQFTDFYPDQIEDESLKIDLSYSAATAEVAALCQSIGPVIEQQTMEEVGELLGRTFRSEPEALRALNDRIFSDPEKDIEDTILTLYRHEARREYLYEPVQKLTGLASRSPVKRLF